MMVVAVFVPSFQVMTASTDSLTSSERETIAPATTFPTAGPTVTSLTVRITGSLSMSSQTAMT